MFLVIKKILSAKQKGFLKLTQKSMKNYIYDLSESEKTK